ncbi:hypothetical protein WOSG25_080550 [Weissella oryzae SG25]|uniref:Acid-resistance membrane protein n=1 Tax=Weissella oryzae (strain DSM 25784 / JCM 18191 / LMG 30913 / SG25) TaxID=1329250 RepID=A0A069CVH3_WEIOS|nr:DUF308 domain-containing protein [Weissella oryzae]GAK31223.1 hypothetical protein WOSG25_080550 [Weissella oryzae SG25]
MFSDSFFKHIRNGIGFDGLLSVIFGALILFWPGRTAAVAAILIGLAFILIGLGYVFTVFRLDNESGWGRLGHLLLGALYLIAGIFTFVDLAAATTYYFALIGIFVGITWLVESFVGFSMARSSASPAWMIFSAILSLLAGIILLFSPFWGALLLWTLLGSILLVLGIFKLVRYFTWK